MSLAYPGGRLQVMWAGSGTVSTRRARAGNGGWKPMIWLPPGDPISSTGEPSPSNTMVGAIELRGRLPGATALASGRPARSTGRKAKSVSSLLSRKPAAHRREPNPLSIVVVTAMDLTKEDRLRLTTQVQQVLQKGAYDRESLLSEVRALVTALATPNATTK